MDKEYSMCYSILKALTVTLLLFLVPTTSTAQIGYQVALINNATGEPRALETVKVDLSITNNEGKTIYSGSQSATTNDFGILSLSVGNSNTFKDVDWTKLPFYISAEVDGILIGKTQILSVPVAEHALHTGQLTPEKLCERSFEVTFDDNNNLIRYTFNLDYTGLAHEAWGNGPYRESSNTNFRWYIDGNSVIAIDGYKADYLKYIPELDKLIFLWDGDGRVLSR